MWILKYWLGVLFGLLSGVTGYAARRFYRRRRMRETEHAAMKEGMLALLHSEICRCHAECDRRGYANIHDRENIELLYKPYHALGGNGTGTDLYNRMRHLPTEPLKRGGME